VLQNTNLNFCIRIREATALKKIAEVVCLYCDVKKLQ